MFHATSTVVSKLILIKSRLSTIACDIPCFNTISYCFITELYGPTEQADPSTFRQVSMLSLILVTVVSRCTFHF